MVQRPFMVRCVIGSIIHGGFIISRSSQCSMTGVCYPICGMVHIKEHLLIIGNNSSCGGSGFPLSLF